MIKTIWMLALTLLFMACGSALVVFAILGICNGEVIWPILQIMGAVVNYHAMTRVYEHGV